MKKLIRSSYFAIIIAAIYLPIGIMVLFSFNSGTSVSNWLGFSSKWYTQFFQDSTFIKSIITTLFVAVVSTIVSLVIGVSAAIGLSKLSRRKQNRWLTISNIPLINADIITAVALMVVFLLCGIKFGIFTLIMAHISFNVPYVIITIMPRLRKVDKSIIEASNDLGAKSSTVIFKVILPILKPAIILAAVIAFAMSFDDFIISYFTGGDQQNVSGFIYSAKRIKPFIFAFGTIVIGIIAIAVIIWNAFLIVSEKNEQNKMQLKNKTYKQKEVFKLEQKLENQKNNLKNLSIIKKTFNVFLWFEYLNLKIKLSIAKSKNFDKKISVLEWKRYKLQNEINTEKRYKTRLLKATKRLSKLNDLLNKTNDVKKAAKYSIEIEKLEEKIDFLNEEIDWINERDNKSAIKAQLINKKLKQLEKEFAKEIDPSKSTIKWYNKKIKYYKEWKIEVEEGKNNYKLRLIVEKLQAYKNKNEDHIRDISLKLDLLSEKIYQVTPIANDELNNLKNQSYINAFEIKTTKSINKIENKIQFIKNKISKANDKYFAIDTEEVNFTKGFFTRTWKLILVSIIGLASFSALAVAYVKNNTYDLTIGNWGEYIDRSLLKEFEDEHKVKINYQEYDSNETLYNKLYTFSYDIMVPSDYMVQKLAEENKLQKLDYSRLNVVSKSFNYIDSNGSEKISGGINTDKNNDSTKALTINSNLLNVMGKSVVKNSDINSSEEGLGTDTIIDYALNYLWGDLIIVVNPNSNGRSGGENIKWLIDNCPEAVGIEDEGGKLTPIQAAVYDANNKYGIINSELSWDILWKAAKDNKRVILNEDPKNIFAIGGQKLYGKGNLTNKQQVLEVEKEMNELIKNKSVGLEGDSLIQTAAEGRFDFAVMYNGDASYANTVWNNEDDSENNKTMNEKDKVYFLYGRPNKKHESNFIESTNVYSDNIVLSKNVKNKDLAYDFINFIIENASDISNFTGTPTPYDETLNEMVDGNGVYANYKKMFEPIIMQDKNSNNSFQGEVEPFFYNGEIDNYLVDRYTNLIAGKQN